MLAIKVKIYGIVQGVGFRPVLYNIFKSYTGWVRNSSCCVELYIESAKPINIERIIIKNKPKNAFIRSIDYSVHKIKKCAYRSFVIKYSQEKNNQKNINITPDWGMCKSCQKELFDITNRRYLHPLITCTDCGPRFSIAKDGLFDRLNTTMSAFEMCNACTKEYTDSSQRRFHAQTISCKQCGPRYFYVKNNQAVLKDIQAIQKAAIDLTRSKVGLLKGIGGYHLICNCLDKLAVEKIKYIKHREEKPFAVIVRDIETAKKYAYLQKSEIDILESQIKPILLAKSKNDYLKLVNLESPFVGIMLPYAPIHLLLFYFSRLDCLAATSANLSESPLIYKDSDAVNFSGVDFVLLHNRKILRPIEDSIVHFSLNKQLIYRYARGFAPSPFYLKGVKPNILALGADMKNNIAITLKDTIVLSQYTPDLSNYENYEQFSRKVNDFLSFFDIKKVDLAICDKHPNYLSSSYAREAFPCVVETQHHKAHFASVLMENDYYGDCVAVVLDGTGFGDDGNIWGGEFFVKEKTLIKRIGHIKYFPIFFGDKAIKEPYRIAASYMYEVTKDIEYVKFLFPEYKDVISLIPKLKPALTSSAGRLFDAVSALINIKHKNTFEAQSAMLLEYEAEKHKSTKILDYKINDFIIDFSETLKTIAKRRDLLSARVFHNTFTQAIFENVLSISKHTGIDTIALGGGVFQNSLVFAGLYKKLIKAGLKVMFNSRFPINDGSIAIGQIYLAKEGICV
ncbi:[NiFe] hydrogenase metallocenter assembly protein HypF [Desulfurella amilsii]|uniref:Carbamoyltransferase n=1 Tax=Desulfurella amilsii TaxID=1562698 RepID=A0A1X4XYK0_9BACT|nr:carbamoyltransferase HypF [Desulfurella amilsii]OSS42621.1 [NiFe] hydrogenase metallocenter assembly protein HypF [Desulfurella amilsii]